jgi:hypothetical protein
MNCLLPSQTLVLIRRQAAKDADTAAKRERRAAFAKFVLLVERLRIVHEELTGCQCWYDAVAAASSSGDLTSTNSGCVTH